MSDKIEREIEEIMNRLGEPAPGEGARDRVRRLVCDWTASLRRTIVSRLPHISPRQIKLASLGLVLLVAAALFFGLVYPSLGNPLNGAGSATEDIPRETAGDEIGQAAHVDDARHEGSADEALDTDSRESPQGVDRLPETHGEHHRADSDPDR
jgi:hypothetical protein